MEWELIATTDCNNIRQIVHVGLPDDVGSYVQETGRVSVVTHSPSMPIFDKDIKMYVFEDITMFMLMLPLNVCVVIFVRGHVLVDSVN